MAEILFGFQIVSAIVIISYLFNIKLWRPLYYLVTLDVLGVTPLIIVAAIMVKFYPITWIIFPLVLVGLVFYLNSINNRGSNLAANITKVCVIVIKIAALVFTAKFIF